MKRRTFMSLLAAAPLCYSKHSYSPASSAPRLIVAVDEPLGTINPRLYGQFTEHIGQVVYGGIWVGSDSRIPNVRGFRTDTIEALKRVAPSIVRWPGGCYADAYQWQDGVGPASQRPNRHNVWWLREEPNTFGTDEFLDWCHVIGAEPFLTANVGTGSPAEALNWLEYCNGTGNTTYAQMRVKNGHPQPYGVRMWGIGNENWGCGGLFSPAEYAHSFRDYAVYFKRMGLSSDVELVGVGSIEEGWNAKFLDAAGPGLPYLDYLSIHKYFRRGPSITFSDADYTSLMLDLTEFETLIRTSLAAIDEVEPRRAAYHVFGRMPRNKPIELSIDEWGVWHSDAVITDGFRENGTLRDAIFAASALNLFQQFPQRLTMSNVAQVTNCLQALILNGRRESHVDPDLLRLRDVPRTSGSSSRSDGTLEYGPNFECAVEPAIAERVRFALEKFYADHGGKPGPERWRRTSYSAARRARVVGDGYDAQRPERALAKYNPGTANGGAEGRTSAR